jgi:hypothetical protein
LKFQEAFSGFQVGVTFQNRNILSAVSRTLNEAGSAIFEEVWAAYATPNGEVSEKGQWYSMFRVLQMVLHLNNYYNKR